MFVEIDLAVGSGTITALNREIPDCRHTVPTS